MQAKLFSRSALSGSFHAAVIVCAILHTSCMKPRVSVVASSQDIASVPAPNSNVVAQFGSSKDFFFGVATAPAHGEDQLEDGWIEFGRSGKIAAFKNQAEPEERIKFWSEPQREIDLAVASGSKVLRMGVDWQRLAPFAPNSSLCPGGCPLGVQDQAALGRYKEIVKMARAKGLSVMMTLFHHSMPKWGAEMGGWTNPALVPLFEAFSGDVIRALAADVDYWITINEPWPFLLFTYVAGIWPGGTPHGFSEFVNLGPVYQGAYSKGFKNMIEAHKGVYDLAHRIDTVVADPDLPDPAPAKVGMANNIAVSVPARPIDGPTASIFQSIAKFSFTDATINHSDFLGFNYYGKEFIKGDSVEIRPNTEYSETGRAVYPSGLYELVKVFHHRYNIQQTKRTGNGGTLPEIPIIITENGIADSTDILRPAYIIEHLIAVNALRAEKIPVRGFIHWTISDNMEWAYGYCPKFGLVNVDRANRLQREPRKSMALYRNIAKAGAIYESQRTAAWDLVQSNAGKPRPFCVDMDGKTPLNTPTTRNILKPDWQFSSTRSN